uniref:Putative secreted protein n=1 Tax=Ixodes scapularis TaxID=6945 RepID=A0A4D5RX52_IXOSC
MFVLWALGSLSGGLSEREPASTTYGRTCTAPAVRRAWFGRPARCRHVASLDSVGHPMRTDAILGEARRSEARQARR